MLPPLLLRQLEGLEGGALSAALDKYLVSYQLKWATVDGEVWARNQREFYGKCIAELEGMGNAVLAGASSQDSSGGDTEESPA